jgi:hypothetical protein
MRSIRLILVLAALALLLAGRPYWSSLADVDLATAAPGYTSRDWRTSQFAVQTGWMTFRELWFNASGGR